MPEKEKNVIKEEYFPIITEAVGQSKGYTDEKFKTIHWLMVGVVIVCFIGFVTLIIDSFHMNSVTYKEYSQKIESAETPGKTNEALLKQIQDLSEQNNKNQEIIIELQKQILNILNK